jgi:hypothetical protein
MPSGEDSTIDGFELYWRDAKGSGSTSNPLSGIAYAGSSEGVISEPNSIRGCEIIGGYGRY